VVKGFDQSRRAFAYGTLITLGGVAVAATATTAVLLASKDAKAKELEEKEDALPEPLPPAPGEEDIGPVDGEGTGSVGGFQTSGDNAKLIADKLEAAGYPEDWIIFLLAKAHSESRYNPYTGRGDPTDAPPYVNIVVDAAEANAARTAYETVTQKFGRLLDCPWSKNRYAYTAGLFGLMPAYDIKGSFAKTDLECMDPWEVFEVNQSLAMATNRIARTKNYKAYKDRPTWEIMWRSWLSLTSMQESKDGTPRIEKSLQNFRDGLAAIGVDPSFMNQGLSPNSEVPFGGKAVPLLEMFSAQEIGK